MDLIDNAMGLHLFTVTLIHSYSFFLLLQRGSLYLDSHLGAKEQLHFMDSNSCYPNFIWQLVDELHIECLECIKDFLRLLLSYCPANNFFHLQNVKHITHARQIKQANQ